MVLRKPYAFFIKMFKPLHLLASVLNIYMIFLTSKMVTFLSNYIYSEDTVVGQVIRASFNEKSIYIIIVTLVLLSLLMFGVMYRKQKPILFYFVSIMLYIVITVMYVYAFGFFNTMEKTIVAIKSAKLMHDLILISIIIETVLAVIYVIRGMGLDFKKFDFSSDIAKLDISESDKEEFEVNVNFNIDEFKRKSRNKIRNLKYLYYENKFIINIVLGSIIILSALFIVIKPSEKREGKVYNTSIFNIKINDSYITNKDYKGKKISNNYLIIVNTEIGSNIGDSKLYSNDFSLNIGNAIFKPTTEYDSAVSDIGASSSEIELNDNISNQLFVFEIPKKYITSKMMFSYRDHENDISILIKPKRDSEKSNKISKNLTEELSIPVSHGNIKFKIEEYEINSKFLINYKYCINNKNCIDSKEYLAPSIDENFDKYILKLKIDYNSDNVTDADTFYKLLSKYGLISYKNGDNWVTQDSNFELITSKKSKQKNTVYIGVNSEIYKSSEIKFAFQIRDNTYEYILKKGDE